MAEQTDLQVSPPVIESNDVNGTESSTVQNAVATNDVNVPATDSSTVAKDEKPKNVFEAVKASLAAMEAEKAGATSSAVADGVKSNQAVGASNADPKDDDELIDSLDPKGRASARIRELVEENKRYSTQAQNFESLKNWTAESGLEQTEFVEGLQIMRAMKQDPFAAYEMLKPYMEQLESIVGERLPNDIQEKLDTGLLDEETARELVAARNKNSIFEQRQQQSVQQQEAMREAQAQEQFVQSIQQSVTNWDLNWKGSDPDYAKKLPLVLSAAAHIRSTEGYPQSKEMALDQVKRAKDSVEKHLKGILPPRANVQTVTGGGGNNVVTKPKSSLEAARAALSNPSVNY